MDGLDGLIFWMDGLDVINILDGLDRCPSDGMDWMLDGLLTTLLAEIPSGLLSRLGWVLFCDWVCYSRY